MSFTFGNERKTFLFQRLVGRQFAQLGRYCVHVAVLKNGDQLDHSVVPELKSNFKESLSGKQQLLVDYIQEILNAGFD